MGKIEEIRQAFPILGRTVYGRPLVYLDNAATAQKPHTVLDEWMRMTAAENANIHRAVHALAVSATDSYERTRDCVRDFLHAGSREEIIFTSGTTAAINLVAYAYGEAFVREGDEIIVSEAEHHSNIVPWQLLCLRKKAVLKVLEIDENGYLSVDNLRKLISQKTKIVAICQISNVLGLKNPVKYLIAVCHEKGIPVLVDGAQGCVHEMFDIQDLDCDFYAFSGHKIYAATGVGVLYGKKKWLEAMPPFLSGGEMIGTVRFSETTFAPLPQKFEAGTQNISSVPTLIPAIDWMKQVRLCPEVESEQKAIVSYLLDALGRDERITLYGVPRRTEEKVPLFSFSVSGAHHEDLALILDKMGVAVRSGQMCAEPLMDHFGVTGMVRASFAPYNTLREAEFFVECLNKALKMLL